jgi:hypothetical protein
MPGSSRVRGNPNSAGGGGPSPPGGDALHARIERELLDFLDWLEEHGVKGYIGEVGWPAKPAEDAGHWNGLAHRWFELADRAGVWVTVWAAGEWWSQDYRLAIYRSREAGSALDSPTAQAEVLETHLDLPDALHGVNVAGGEFSAPVDESTSSFSNRRRGTYDRDYHYDSSETFDFLSSRGIALVRIPFRWERLQPELGNDLDRDELHRLKEVVSHASAAELEVVLDMHNYGAFYLEENGRGVRCPLGSEQCTIEDFADAWRRISAAFEDTTIAFGLMNEPVGLAPSGGISEAEIWHGASQRALSAIRDGGDDRVIMVAGYFWAGVRHWDAWNPTPWIKDPANRFLYEAHHYFDRDGSGRYQLGYEDEVIAAPEDGDDPF